MFGDSYLKSPSTHYKETSTNYRGGLSLTKPRQSDSILGTSILRNIDRGDQFDYSNAAAVVVEQLKVIAREIAQYQSQNDKQGMEKCLLEYVQVANDQTQDLELTAKKEQESAERILENTIQMISECSTFYSDIVNIDLYQELFYDTFNNIARI
jgi:hypothetical protein